MPGVRTIVTGINIEGRPPGHAPGSPLQAGESVFGDKDRLLPDTVGMKHEHEPPAYRRGIPRLFEDKGDAAELLRLVLCSVFQPETSPCKGNPAHLSGTPFPVVREKPAGDPIRHCRKL